MERQHLECLVADYGVSPERISLLDSFDPKRRGDEIEDPMNQGSVVFDRCYTLIRDCIIHYLDTTNEIPETPRLNFEVQHRLVAKEALIGCFVAMSFSRSVV